MVIVAEDVRRRYGETVALDGVSLSVSAGEVVCLIGPNGAGKTTLVRALLGTTDADGHVELFGGPPRQAPRDRIGLLPQSFDPPGRLSARELLAYYAGLYDEARDVAAVLADVGLTAAADTWYERLSGGQQRRLCVGAALVNEPELLVLDEPTTGIDPAGRRDLWGLLEELAAGGTTVVLTTHDMAEAERLADRVGLLVDGRLLALDTPAALIERHGGDSRLEIATDDRDAVGVLDAAGFAGQPADRRVVVEGIEPRAIGDVATVLEDAGIDYAGLVWREPTLEDVYFALVGDDTTPDAGNRSPTVRAIDGVDDHVAGRPGGPSS